MSKYFVDGYIDSRYFQSGVSVDWSNRVIYVPRDSMTLVQTTPIEIRELNIDTFRLTLKALEESDAGMVFPVTHNHNTSVLLGGIEYARIVEIINDYVVEFEDGQYAVNLVGANSNIADRININQVSVRSANSAGLIQTREIQQASYNNQVAIDSLDGTAGTNYPIGTLQRPVSNLDDALFIASQRGLDEFFLVSNYTFQATDNVSSLRFEGNGATLNVARTTVTFTQGCITTNSQWTHCKITGYQGGESQYHDCTIDGLDNAHCFYERCGLIDGTARGYTIRQNWAVGTGHASYFKECYSDEGTAIIDRNGARLNVTFDGFNGRIKFINQNHPTSSGQVWIHMNGGTVTVDASCTTGKITVTGVGTLVNQSGGTQVDASGFTPEQFAIQTLNLEALRQTHQAYGQRFFVDPVNGNDLSPGTSPSAPVQTLNAALARATSGRGDVIYLLSPGAGVATIAERVVIDKEDVHIRGPGRGLQIQPATTDSNTPIINITANNCSLSGFVLRSHTGEVAGNAIECSGKFARFDKIYMVGPGQTGNTCSGLVFTGGDYHELWDMEIEKYGDAALSLDDQSDFHANGSPREISVFGGNFYLNGNHGFHLHGKPGAALGSTSRFIRILRGANIHDNLSYGVHSQANVQSVVIDDSVMIHDNNAGGAQVLLDGTGYYKAEANVGDIWNAASATYNAAGTMGNRLNAASSGGVDYGALATAVWTQPIEATFTAEQILKIAAAVLAGKVSGAGTGVETFTGIDGSTIRVVSTTDAAGNRTAVAVNGA